MKVLVCGATGMLGHRVLQILPTYGHEVVGTVRGAAEEAAGETGPVEPRLIGGISVEPEGLVERVLDSERPDVVVNCIGVVKQLASANDPLVAIPVNALFPHRLARACTQRGVRIIHFSTDCVFSGNAGPYTEASPPDPQDLYGRSKLLGEINAPNALTLRTSIIGHEIGGGTGLVSWILRNRGGRVSGFVRALYTGVTTDFMTQALTQIITDFPKLYGVWHLSADPISKYDLICLVNEIYGLDLTIDRDEAYVCDRRLDSTMFRSRTGIVPPTWREMLQVMYENHQQL